MYVKSDEVRSGDGFLNEFLFEECKLIEARNVKLCLPAVLARDPVKKNTQNKENGNADVGAELKKKKIALYNLNFSSHSPGNCCC